MGGDAFINHNGTDRLAYLNAICERINSCGRDELRFGKYALAYILSCCRNAEPIMDVNHVWRKRDHALLKSLLFDSLTFLYHEAVRRSAMAYTFKSARINMLSMAHVAVLDGELLGGVVMTDSAAKVALDGRSIPMRIKGVALGPNKGVLANSLSLTVDHRQDAMKVISVGDVLVSE